MLNQYYSSYNMKQKQSLQELSPTTTIQEKSIQDRLKACKLHHGGICNPKQGES